jgi:hypothetical protein
MIGESLIYESKKVNAAYGTESMILEDETCCVVVEPPLPQLKPHATCIHHDGVLL